MVKMKFPKLIACSLMLLIAATFFAGCGSAAGNAAPQQTASHDSNNAEKPDCCK